MEGDGIDITIKRNPNHVLSPNDWDMVTKARSGKISPSKYRTWYLNLLRDRWETRKQEFLDLAKLGKDKTIKLKCFCGTSSRHCHAYTAAAFMNAIIEKLPN